MMCFLQGRIGDERMGRTLAPTRRRFNRGAFVVFLVPRSCWALFQQLNNAHRIAAWIKSPRNAAIYIGWRGDDHDNNCFRFLIQLHSKRSQGSADDFQIAARWTANGAMICVEPSLSFQTRSGPSFPKKELRVLEWREMASAHSYLAAACVGSLFGTHNQRRLPAWSNLHSQYP
jgi:hypothetical protein